MNEYTIDSIVEISISCQMNNYTTGCAARELHMRDPPRGSASRVSWVLEGGIKMHDPSRKWYRLQWSTDRSCCCLSGYCRVRSPHPLCIGLAWIRMIHCQNQLPIWALGSCVGLLGQYDPDFSVCISKLLLTRICAWVVMKAFEIWWLIGHGCLHILNVAAHNMEAYTMSSYPKIWGEKARSLRPQQQLQASSSGEYSASNFAGSAPSPGVSMRDDVTLAAWTRKAFATQRACTPLSLETA